MAITLNDIRNLGANDRIVLDPNAQGGTGALKSVGKWQRFKIFFNIGGARQQNKDTIAAIRNTIVATFTAQDLKDEAMRLLNAVRTDRAIGGAEIKSIMMKLDSLAKPAALDARVTMHAAALGLPPDADLCGENAVKVAQSLVRREHALGANPATVDVVARTRDGVYACARAVQAVQVPASRPEPELRHFVAQNVGRFVLNPDDSLRTNQQILQDVGNTCDFFRNAMAAFDQTQPHAFPDGAAQEAATRANARARDAVLDFLRETSPVDANLFGAIEAQVRAMPMHELRDLPANATPAQILGAFRAVIRAADPARLQLQPGVQAPSGPIGQAALMRFICQWAALQMPEANRRALLDLLQSVSGEKALGIQANAAQRNDPAGVLECRATLDLIEILLKLDGRPTAPAGDRDAKIADFSPAERCAYRPGDAFGGDAAPQLRDAILGNAGIPASGGTSVRQLHERIDAGVRTLLDGSFATAMKDIAVGIHKALKREPEDGEPPADRFNRAFSYGDSRFDTSLAPSNVFGMEQATAFQMPDGSLLPNKDPAAARDILARVATGRADADYATLSPADRAKANILIALVACDPFESVARGVNTALSRDGDSDAFETSRFRAEQKLFQLSGSAAEGFCLRCGTARIIDSVTCPGDSGHVSGNGTYTTLAEIRLSPADLDHLAQQDWRHFDDSGFRRETFMGDDMNLGRITQTVPPAFKFSGDISASFSLDFNTLQPAARADA